MIEFMFNSASVPLADKEMANNEAKRNFYALFEYGSDKKFSLNFDRKLEEVFLSENYSLIDFLNYLKLDLKDKDLASLFEELIDSGQTLDCSEFEYYGLKIGDDTRFDRCNCIKYACLNDAILFSISDDNFWKREKIICSIFYEITYKNYEICNLFSEKISHLPVFLPQFTLKDPAFFIKTRKFKKGAVIYKEIQTKHYWYKDTFHTGASEHYEVFDFTGRTHLGEAEMNGMLDTSKADRSKHIDDLI